MNCKFIQPRISAYIDRELSGAEMLTVREHLGVCAACRSEETQLRNLKSLLSGMAVPEPSADLEDRLTAAVLRDRQTKRVPTLLHSVLLFASVTGCTMAATLVILSSIAAGNRTTSAVQPKSVPQQNIAWEVRRDEAAATMDDPVSGAPIVSADYGR